MSWGGPENTVDHLIWLLFRRPTEREWIRLKWTRGNLMRVYREARSCGARGYKQNVTVTPSEYRAP